MLQPTSHDISTVRATIRQFAERDLARVEHERRVVWQQRLSEYVRGAPAETVTLEGGAAKKGHETRRPGADQPQHRGL